MTEPAYPFDSDKLSPEDLEAIRAFLETEDFEMLPPDTSELPSSPQSPLPPGTAGEEIAGEAGDEEMLDVFTNEVRGDIEVLRQALAQVEQDERLDSPGLLALRRVAHKIRGTSAAIGCDAISSIAHAIEILIEMGRGEQLELFATLIALSHAIGSLQMTLESVEMERQESMLPLLALESDFEALGIHIDLREGEDAPPLPTVHAQGDEVRLDRQRARLLLEHIEQATGQQNAMEDARQEVEHAMADVLAAQARLRRVETYVATMQTTLLSNRSRETGLEELSSSSLVARILREAPQRTGNAHLTRTRLLPMSAAPIETITWDELELDNYTETSILAHALNEAVADVATATSQLQAALAQLDSLVKQQSARMRIIRDNARVLSPHEHHTLQQSVLGLLVRAGEQQVIVPFAQVARVEQQARKESEDLFSLDALLGYGQYSQATSPGVMERPVIILRDDLLPAREAPHAQWEVEVDEIVGQVELPAQPVPQPLRRPGITGMCIDKTGAVLPVLDLPALIRYRSNQAMMPESVDRPAHRHSDSAPRILIADDSIYMRRSLRQTLGQQGYVLLEASDGIEALERMTADAPDVLLLDLEMPNLNGYDLLSIRRSRDLLPDLKVILLTSRTSDKHRQRAQELGIHAYLTKPCPEDVLRKTIADLLNS
jgi:CheY-like chemotaxis protein/HPt (histidine-containing phosphotransfer) domain-containing protein